MAVEDGIASKKEVKDRYIAALKEELRACEVNGKKERVKAIKAELGMKSDDDEKPKVAAK